MSTFGKTSIGATEDTSGSANIYACVFTPTEAGIITKITIRVGSFFGACTLGAAIYADSAGVPGTLLANSPAQTSVGAGATWYDVPISYTFLANTPYWLTAWASANNIDYVYDAGAANQRVWLIGKTPFSWPTPFGTASGQDARAYSFYATYYIPHNFGFNTNNLRPRIFAPGLAR